MLGEPIIQKICSKCKEYPNCKYMSNLIEAERILNSTGKIRSCFETIEVSIRCKRRKVEWNRNN